MNPMRRTRRRLHVLLTAALAALLAPAEARAAGSIAVAVSGVRIDTSEPANRTPRCVELRHAAERPRIDGRLDEPCWRMATLAEPFLRLGGAAPAREQTSARLLSDGEALYIGFVCRESRMDRLVAQVTRHDGTVWLDDCVEIFIDANHDHRTYHHFIVNSLATRLDARMGESGRLDLKWDAPWQAAARTDKDRWTVEVAIPFASIGGRPDYFGINLCREEQPNGELSSWAPQQRRFATTPDELSHFFDVVCEPVPFRVERLVLGNHGWGENLAEMTIHNRTARPATWEARVRVVSPAGTSHDASSDARSCAAGTAMSLKWPFRIQRLVPGWWQVDVSVRDVARNRWTRVGRFPFQVESTEPLHVYGRIACGPRYVLRAKLRAVLGRATLRDAVCRLAVFDLGGQRLTRRDLALGPVLYPRGEADLRIDLSGLAHGRYVLSAQVIDRSQKPVTDEIRRAVIKVPGPFDVSVAASANPVPNPSFEEVKADGAASGWVGYWWARRSSGLARVPASGFLSVDSSVAGHGRRSIRIRSTRGGSAPSPEVLTVRMPKRIPLKPGTAYRLGCLWKCEGIVGMGKAWVQTPKRQVVFPGTVNGTQAEWQRFRASFTPDERETWCLLNFSLDGKGGTLWVDDVSLAEEEPRLLRVLQPNALRSDGVGLLGGNVAGRGLRLAVEVVDPEDERRVGGVVVPAEERRVPFAMPGLSCDRRLRLVARLLTPSGRILDARSAAVLGAPTPPGAGTQRLRAR